MRLINLLLLLYNIITWKLQCFGIESENKLTWGELVRDVRRYDIDQESSDNQYQMTRLEICSKTLIPIPLVSIYLHALTFFLSTCLFFLTWVCFYWIVCFSPYLPTFPLHSLHSVSSSTYHCLSSHSTWNCNSEEPQLFYASTVGLRPMKIRQMSQFSLWLFISVSNSRQTSPRA